MTIKAIIFDMDDTLASTARLWKKAEAEFLNWLGEDYSEELASEYKGMNSLDIGAFLWGKFKPSSLSKESCQKKMRACLLSAYEGHVEEMPGATNFIQKVSDNYKLAIASGSPKQAIEKVMHQHNWSELIDIHLSSEEVKRGKPSPDVFLAAANFLDCHASEILVFEDSGHGVMAARNAGMKCFVIPSTPINEEHKKADRVLDNFDSVQLDESQKIVDI